MKQQKHFLTLLLLLGAWPGAGTTQAQTAGSVVAWGNNYYGQTTIPLAAQSGVTAIAARGSDFWDGDSDHAIALKSDGSVVAWGQISDGTNFVAATVPTNVSGVIAIAAGTFHNVAIKSDGSVVAWGGNWAGQATVPVAAQSGVTAIAAGFSHTVALKNDGSVVAWGANVYGQVTGTPTTDDYPYSATASPVALGGHVLRGVTAIAAGLFHTVALKDDGSVVEWGDNYAANRTVPVAAQSGVTAIAAGLVYTVALKSDGSVVAWGDDGEGQTDVPVAAQSGVTAIAAGSWHTVALKNDGSVVAWGWNGQGAVTGTPTTSDPYSATASPVTLNGQVLSGVTAIAAGEYFTVALIGSVPVLPSLNVRPIGNALLLSWPTNAVGFTLQENPDLTTSDWTDVSVVPIVNITNQQNEVMVSLPVGKKFYRLKSH